MANEDVQNADAMNANNSISNINTSTKVERLKSLVKSYPDFPKPGILFRDFLPIFRNPDAVNDLIDVFAEHVQSLTPKADVIIGLESRGFLIGPLLAVRLGLPFVPIRKAGKLPGPVEKMAYALEYGTDVFELQREAVMPNNAVILIDDLLATGGSLSTSISLINKCDANVVTALVVIELEELKGRDKINSVPVYSLITY